MNPKSSYSYVFSLPAGVEETFRLFSDPGLLDELTPRWFNLEPTSDFSLPLTQGAEISYRLRWRRLPLRWTSRIVNWEPPHLLTYEQVRGPYRSFRHEHRFEAEEARTGIGTRVVDRVIYRARGGLPIERFLVRPDLERIFRHREQVARRILGARISESQAGVEGDSFIPLTSASSSAIEPPT